MSEVTFFGKQLKLDKEEDGKGFGVHAVYNHRCFR